jgi:hypothetical protein
MDPNACWARYLDACKAGDFEEAAAALEDLRGWVVGGGAMPMAFGDMTLGHALLVLSKGVTLLTLTARCLAAR